MIGPNYADDLHIDDLAKANGTNFKGYQMNIVSLDVIVSNEAARIKLLTELGDYAYRNGVTLNVTLNKYENYRSFTKQ